MAIGGVVVLLVVGMTNFLLPRDERPPVRSSPGPAPLDPYADRLAFSNIKMSAATNFVGGTVTYVEGKVTNNGDKTLAAATIEAIFKDSLGQIVQKEQLPLAVIYTHQPYVDTAPLASMPLASGKSQECRLTFDHISASWNHEYPELRVISTTLK